MSRKLWDDLRDAAVDTGAAMMLVYLVLVVIGIAAFLVGGIP
jgi:hypothetical protein